MRYLAIPSFAVNGCSFDHDLDFDVLLGRWRPSLLGLFDRVQHAVVLRLPVPLLDVHVNVHVLNRVNWYLLLQMFYIIHIKKETNHDVGDALPLRIKD